MNILTVFTGGTIGSKVVNNVIDLSTDNDYIVLKMVLEKYKDYKDINFICEEPIEYLSENLNYSQLNTIIKFLNSIDFSNYDGVIITHGSDTLSYTASYLGLLFSYINIPIVIVASDYPPNDIKSNAIINFKNAIDFIIDTRLKGVYVSYTNNKNNAIYISTDIKEAEPYSDVFTAFSKFPLGYMQQSKFKMHIENNKTIKEIQENKAFKLKSEFSLTKNVLMINQYPNLDYNIYNINSDISAVLICLYHSGTAPTNTQENSSLISFIEKCQKNKINVFGTSFKNSKDIYATTNQLLNKGLIPLYNMSNESAYAKLCIAYNQTDIEPIEYMKKVIFFESI